MSHHTATNADSTVVNVKVPDKSLWKCLLNNPSFITYNIPRNHQLLELFQTQYSQNSRIPYLTLFFQLTNLINLFFWSYTSVIQNMATAKWIYDETLCVFVSLDIEVSENENKLCYTNMTYKLHKLDIEFATCLCCKIGCSQIMKFL